MTVWTFRPLPSRRQHSVIFLLYIFILATKDSLTTLVTDTPFAVDADNVT